MPYDDDFFQETCTLRAASFPTGAHADVVATYASPGVELACSFQPGNAGTTRQSLDERAELPAGIASAAFFFPADPGATAKDAIEHRGRTYIVRGAALQEDWEDGDPILWSVAVDACP